MRGKKILVADDDGVTLETLGAQLRGVGFHVVTAMDAMQGVHDGATRGSRCRPARYSDARRDGTQHVETPANLDENAEHPRDRDLRAPRCGGRQGSAGARRRRVLSETRRLRAIAAVVGAAVGATGGM